MKVLIGFTTLTTLSFFATNLSAQTNDQGSKNSPIEKQVPSRQLYIDVHHVGPGKVTAKDVAGAHNKDLEVQKKYGVSFIKYWVDETNGNIYCLAEAADSQSIRKTHAEAHGLVPDHVHMVTPGKEAAIKGPQDLYLDLHVIGPGKVNAAAVASAHEKDLAVQGRHGVNFINYWVDEKNGTIVCLAQAHNADSIISAHRQAHGLLPVKVEKVKQGQ